MRKSIVVLSLLLASCGSTAVEFTPATTDAPSTTEVVTTTTEVSTTTEAPKPVETRPTLPPVTTSASTYDPDGYILSLATNTTDLYWLFDDDVLLDLGLAVCMDFDSGMTVDEELMSLTYTLVTSDASYLSYDIGIMVGSAIFYLCPEYIYLLP